MTLQDWTAQEQAAVLAYTVHCVEVAVSTERARFSEVFNMARICAENNMKRADDCGELARKLLTALDDLKT